MVASGRRIREDRGGVEEVVRRCLCYRHGDEQCLRADAGDGDHVLTRELEGRCCYLASQKDSDNRDVVEHHGNDRHVG